MRRPGSSGRRFLFPGAAMQIENGILRGVRFVKAHASGGAMSPRWVVLHDTAGSLRQFSSVEWFASIECGTSAHFVVERDGTITQMVPTNKRAFHAGVSHWKGVSGLNSCSVGIEIVNPGKLDNTGKAYFGKVAEPSEIFASASSAHGKGYWLPYTKEQIAAVIAICRAVVEEYPDCNEIVTHYEISPGRKIDVGPHFPLDDVRRAVFDPTPAEESIALPPQPVETTPAPAAPSVAKEVVQSTTSKGLLAVIFGWLADLVFDAGAWVSSLIGSAVDILKSTQTEADDAIAPLVSLGEKLHVNTGRIAVWITLAILAMAVARHVQKRIELARVKAGTSPADGGA